jgi:hypothetical protein
MQLVLVVIVIFVPQTVTVLLDKEQKVDLDKVIIEMPASSETPEPELKSGDAAPADTSSADEQKKMDDLFKK